jgi:hypothetical protein
MSEYEGAVIHRSSDVYGDLVVADGAYDHILVDAFDDRGPAAAVMGLSRRLPRSSG